jgi:molybdopterin-guanine dinucleotide biosynthesis protein A
VTRIPASAAIVLAGGRSERFGRDKRLALLDGRTLLDHVLNAVAKVAEVHVVVARPKEIPPGLPPRVLLAHDRTEFEGPLAGLSAGLERTYGSETALVVGVDMPWLRPEVLRLLLERAADPGGPAGWTLEGPDPALVGPLPLAVRSVEARDAAKRLIKRGERSLRSLVTELNGSRVAAAEWRPFDPDGWTVRDVNRPEDLPEEPPNP